jgi:hypothetical protein
VLRYGAINHRLLHLSLHPHTLALALAALHFYHQLDRLRKGKGLHLLRDDIYSGFNYEIAKFISFQNIERKEITLMI